MRNTFFARLVKVLKLLANEILPLFFWVFLIFGFDSPDVAVITILAAVIHETGHLTAGSSHLAPIIRSHISGFRIKARGAGYLSEIITLSAGPLINILVFILCLPLSGSASGYFSLFGYINLMTALSNLLPVEGYDGYGIVRKILEARESERGLAVLEVISFTVSVILTVLSLWLLLKYGEGYWIFGLFFVTAMSKILNLGKYDNLRE